MATDEPLTAERSPERALEDRSTRGFLSAPPEPLRYAASTRVPHETTGMLCDRIPHGARVLDIGCGTGSISTLIARECSADVVGVEPDPDRAQACRERGLVVECGYYDAERAARLGAFDVIMMADVLEHVADPASLLALASAHLRPGGRILASMPNVAHWSVRMALLRGDFRYEGSGLMDATHLRWFTIATVRTLFASVELSIVDLAWTSGAWLPGYRQLPWTLIPPTYRGSVIHRLVGRFPGLFACQHIVTAMRQAA